MTIDADLSTGYDRLVQIDGHDDMQVAFYPDGSVGLRHVCLRPKSRVTLITAPRFQFDNGHTLLSADPITIEPSCGCSDCGLHGWIRNGRWSAAG